MKRQPSLFAVLWSLLLAAACGSHDAAGSAQDNATVRDAGPTGRESDAASTGGSRTDSADNPAPDAGQSDAGERNTSAAASCDHLHCKKPATCGHRDGRARCVCPDGYDDAAGDGSDCRDRDECADRDSNDCDKNATCKNTQGSYTCSCPGPAYQGDGNSCRCAKGFVESHGLCLAPDGHTCKDNLDCEHDHCVHGICCVQACASPDTTCRSVEAATCEDGHTCNYPAAPDGTVCDDGDACTQGSTCKAGQCQRGDQPTDCDDQNPCTTDSCDPTLGCKNPNNTLPCDDGDACTEGDQCSSGTCIGSTARDCTAQSDACNAGVCDPVDGSCKKRSLADGTTCDDADSCTQTDRCLAGTCTGDGNACGPNATACSAGTPNSCTCAAGFQASLGRCVPNTNECANNPCGANTDCVDPSNAPGDATCSCQPGYEGDPKSGCTAADPCRDNPCGANRGTCSPTSGGKYTCVCAATMREVAGQCVCDMQGTFAMRTELTVSWKNVNGIEDGSGSTHAWSIVRQNYDATGALKLELIACGETNLDLCGTGVPIAGIAAEAYAQYVPIAVWGKAGASSTLVEFNLPAPLPGGTYKTPPYAMLQGIGLSDPLGQWPPKRQDVQGGSDFDGSAVNGARWLDTDQDGLYGLTTYAVGPGGMTPGGPLAPIEPYGTTSPVCPRSDPSAARLAYNYPPALDGLTPRRIKRFSSANRAISALEGQLDSCDQITGKLSGPDNGKTHFDMRIGSCVRADASQGDVACNANLLNFLDGTQTPNSVESHTFVMKRVEQDTTCEQVRALNF